MTEAEKNIADKTFAKHTIREKTQLAIHIGWIELSNLLTDLLQEVLNRSDIQGEVAREDFYYWKVVLEAAITEAEQEFLFELLSASEWDREESTYSDEFPIMELGEGICKKLMDKVLPFELEITRADDNGVWFIGKDNDEKERDRVHA